MKALKITLLSIVVGVTTSTAFSLWQAYKQAKKSAETAENYSDILKKKHDLERAKERVKNQEVTPSQSEAKDTIVALDDEGGEVEFELHDWSKEPIKAHLQHDESVGDEKELRYDKNSLKAWMQFMNYMLSDFNDESQVKFIMYKLFDTEFVPVDPKDQTIVERCMDQRLEFFGEDSRYVLNKSDISLAEVILDAASRADFDYDHGVPFWTQQIVDSLPIDGSTTLDELCSLCEDIAQLDFRQDVDKYYLYGLFALRDDEMQNGTNEAIIDQFSDWEINYVQNVGMD